MEFVINPPQQVYKQLMDMTGKTHGWCHQLYDYKYYSEAFDGFWFMAILDKERDPKENLVASGFLARWDVENEEPLYSIGMYYCKEEYRGNGYGNQVFKAMMDIIGESNAVLTAAFKMSQKYANSYGFKEMPPYWHLEAEVQPGKVKIPEKISSEYTTKNWKEVDENQLDAFDLTICTRNRKKIMRTWFEQNEVYTRVAFDKNQNIVGYCTIRVVNFHRLCVAPFYAENVEIAERLLADVINEIPNFEKFHKLIFWYPEINKNMESLLSRFFPKNAFTIKVDFRTQFTKNLIESRDDAVYSVASSTHQFV